MSRQSSTGRRARTRNPIAAASALAATATMAVVPAVLFTGLFTAEIVERYDGNTQWHVFLAVLFGSWFISFIALNRMVFGD